MRMFQVISENMLHFFRMYAKGACVAGLLAFAPGLAVGFLHMKRQGRNAGRAFFLAAVFGLLAAYLYFVAGITLLSRSEGYSPVVNLRLFSTFGASFIDRMFVYENVLLFVPLGILLFFLARPFRNPAVAFLTGFLSSLAIETAQLCTCRGRFEADDLLTNTIGMMIGFFACKAPAFLYGKRHKKEKSWQNE